MWHLVSKANQDALDAPVSKIEGHDARAEEFDPLTAANIMVWNAAVEAGGAYMLQPKEDGAQYCPICEAMGHVSAAPEGSTPSDVEKNWITYPVGYALDIAREKGLITAPSTAIN